MMEVLLQKEMKKKMGVGLHYNGILPILELLEKSGPLLARTYVFANSIIFQNFLNLAVNRQSGLWHGGCFVLIVVHN